MKMPWADAVNEEARRLQALGMQNRPMIGAKDAQGQLLPPPTLSQIDLTEVEQRGR